MDDPGHGRSSERAIVVLGCRLRFGGAEGDVLLGPAARRAARAAEVFAARGDRPLVFASGGRAWNDVVEADAIARELVRLGVPEARIVRERWSHSTRENARYVRELAEPRGVGSVELVTCAFHASRARFLFEHRGFEVHVTAAADASITRPSGVRGLVLSVRRAIASTRERGAALLDRRFVERSSA